ncbi:Drug/metabolite transporter [Cynara cardunculus var. scolymus]|uniref:Drug/metabolite transporter n=1 Tax=Cynara cardunculus var. scolymus TaxID=59895 RepID=A0A103YAN9_CYNCS|nr:Drug/metabolite transporter [Cynara cardunculus var. scolymus]
MKMKMRSALPFVAMVVGQIAQVGLTLAGKKAIATGMHNFSYVFYSNALASLILLPASFLIHRSANRPALTLSVAGGFLVLGILGICFFLSIHFFSSFLVQVVGYAGLTYAPATVATAILNLIPGFTFVLAIIFGIERFDYGGWALWAKIIGTLVSVVGAIIVTVYTGPAIITSSLSSITPQHLLGQSSDWILGGVLMLIDSVLAAFFIIAQALILKKYSAVLILMLAYCSIITFLSLLASLSLEHDLSAFSLQSKTRLLAILYAGFFGAGFQITIGAWCVKMKGPLFVAMFHPLGIVIAAIMGVIFLGDSLYLGCLLGSLVIVIGFYGVILGKAKEDKIVEANMVGSLKSPLLQDGNEEPNVLLP